MVQKKYEVTVEAVVQRTVFVDAKNIDEAEKLASKEVASLVGAISTEVIQARRDEKELEPYHHTPPFDADHPAKINTQYYDQYEESYDDAS